MCQFWNEILIPDKCFYNTEWLSLVYVLSYEQYRTHSSTNKSAYNDVFETHDTISVRTTVFLKMNPRVWNPQKDIININCNIGLEKMHFVGYIV